MRRSAISLFILSSCAALGACATTSAPARRPRPVVPAREIPFAAGVPPDVQDYLRTIARQIAPAWHEVRAMSAGLLPATHPANRSDLWAEVEVSLDWHGQPRGMRVSQRSGYEPYDASALRVMRRLDILPPLPPSVREASASLRWRFHRDTRAASAGAARLVLEPLPPERALERALIRRDYARAAALLEQHRDRAPTLVAVLADAGLASPSASARKLALPLTSSRRLATLLAGEPELGVWRAAIELLAARKEGALLAGEVDRVMRLEGKAQGGRLLAALGALARAGGLLPDVRARELLARAEVPAVAVAAAACTTSSALLDAAVARAAKQPAIYGPLAVRRCQLAHGAGCAERVRAALSAAPEPTLVALRSFRGTRFDAEIQALARNARASAAARARAIELVGERRLSLPILYEALRATDAEVQIAAARALPAAGGAKLAVSYRLADLVTRASGRVLAEALAALARVGDERFRSDTIRRMGQLAAEGQALVAAALPSYGEDAVAPLAKLLAHRASVVREAAAAALRRIGGEKARRALAAVASEPRARAEERSLEALLRSAARRAPAGAPASGEAS